MITITNTADNTYSIVNDNAYTVYLVIQILNDNLIMETDTTTANIAASATLVQTLDDGFYIIKEYRDSDDTFLGNYIVPVYVGMQNSLNNISRQFIEQASCLADSNCNCEGLFPKTLYLQHCFLMALHLSYSYFTMINKIMTDNFMFTVLSADLNTYIVTLGKWKMAIDRYLELIDEEYGIS